MKSVLFLCTGNSCRSQMAEAWAHHYHKGKIATYSAGIEAHGLNPLAVKVMSEAGIDMSDHRSKTVASLGKDCFDLVVTVCGHAQEHCPVWLGGGKVIHHGFDDPPKLAAQCLSEQEALPHYRRVRDEIGSFVESLLKYFEENHEPPTLDR